LQQQQQQQKAAAAAEEKPLAPSYQSPITNLKLVDKEKKIKIKSNVKKFLLSSSLKKVQEIHGGYL